MLIASEGSSFNTLLSLTYREILEGKQSISKNSFVVENEKQGRVLSKKFIASFNPQNINHIFKGIIFAT